MAVSALLTATIASTALGISHSKKASDAQKRQLDNQKLQTRTAASDATVQRIDQMGKAISSQQVTSAAAGLAPGSSQILVADQQQAARSDISAIESNLESQLAQADIQKEAISSASKAGNIRDLLRLGTTTAALQSFSR